MEPKFEAIQAIDTPPKAIEDYSATVLQVQKALCERLLHVAHEDHNKVLMREWFTNGRAERYGELVDSDPKMHALVEEYMENGSADILDNILEMIDSGLKH